MTIQNHFEKACLLIPGFLIVMLLSLMVSPLHAQKKLPAQQASLHQFHDQFSPVYKASSNDAERTEVYNKFTRHQPALVEKIDWQITDWKGHVESITFSENGQTASVVIVSEMAGIKIRYSDITDSESGGVTRSEWALDQLKNVSEGDPVIFSAKLFKSEAFYKVRNITRKAEICSPNYIIDLQDIKADPNGSVKKSNTAGDESSDDKARGLVFNVGLGAGTHDVAGIISFSYHFPNSHMLTIRRSGTGAFLWGETSYDMGLLYGRSYTTQSLHASFSAGIGVMRGYRTTIYSDGVTDEIKAQLSFPLESQVFILYGNGFGLGVYSFANINPKRMFFGYTVALKVGLPWGAGKTMK